MCFLRMDHHKDFKLCTIQHLETVVHRVWPSCFSPKYVFSDTWIIIQLWNLYHCKWHALKLRVCRGWPSKYEGKWCFSPKCVFSETDHDTDFKLVPLWSACLKTSGCAEFCPLNMKESDVLSQNVFSQKQIIIQLWNLYHCNWNTWKLQGVVSLAL